MRLLTGAYITTVRFRVFRRDMNKCKKWPIAKNNSHDSRVNASTKQKDAYFCIIKITKNAIS